MHLTLFKANFRSLNTTAYHLATPAGKAETDAHVFIGACQLTRRPIMDKIIHKSNCNNLYSKKAVSEKVVLTESTAGYRNIVLATNAKTLLLWQTFFSIESEI